MPFAELAAEAFASKFNRQGKLSPGELGALLRELGILPRRRASGWFLATVDEQPAGILGLDWRGRKSDIGMRSLLKTVGRFGLTHPLRIALMGLALSHECIVGECYVDQVATAAAFRRQGVGTALMEQARIFAAEKGFEVLTLSVAANNPAVRLYERLGFSCTRRRSSGFMKALFGQKEWLYMTLPL